MVMCVLCLVGLFSGCNKGESKTEETTVVSEVTTTKMEVITEENTTEKASEKEITTEEKKTEEKKTEKEEKTTKKEPSSKELDTKKPSATKDQNYSEKEIRDDGSIKETFYENGKAMKIKYTTASGVLKQLEEYTYHKNGKMKSEKIQIYSDKGEPSYGTSINEYDENGVRIRKIFITLDNAKTVDEYNSAKQQKNSYFYDKNGNLVEHTKYVNGKRSEKLWYNGRGGSLSSVERYWEDGKNKKAHEYYENGKKYSEIIYDRNGIKIDTIYYY